MPFGGLLSLAGPIMSGIGAIGGLFGGTPAQQVQGYSNTGGAQQGAFQGTQNLGQYNVPGQLLPQYQQIAQQGVNNPYQQSYLSGAQQTGQQGMQSGQQLTQGALSQLPNVQALISMGFDPQQALYSQLQNQNQQQNAAILGQSGVASTPYGAGVQQQANTNFNLGWEQQALQRASTAEQGAGSLLGSIGGATNTGLNQMQQGAGLPYNTYQGITGNQLGLLGQAGQFGQSAANIPQQQIQDYLSYLSGSQGQQGANLSQANSTFNQQQQLGGQLGQSLAGLSKGWGNAFGGGGNTGGNVGGWSPASAGAQGSPFYGPIQ